MQTIKRRYLSVGGRRVHYRQVGEGPPLVMLHGSPGDSAMLEAEMQAASDRFTCIALDTPGFGDSAPLPGDVLSVRDLAEATAAAMTAMGLPPCRVFGTHTGAAIGVELGCGWPGQVSGLVLEGLPIFTPEEIEAFFDGYFAPVTIDPLGGHFTQTWVRFRDQFTWFPWRSRSVARLNPVDRPTPEEIDHWVSMFFRSCKTYGPAYKAACYYGHGAFVAAAGSKVPTVYMASAEDMLFSHLDRLPDLGPSQRIERLAYDPAAKHRAIASFADALPGGCGRPSPQAFSLVGQDPAKGFIDGPDGQVFVRGYGDPNQPALILLHDAPGTGLGLEALARRLTPHAYVIVPDLPGVGDSAPPPEDRPVLEAAATALTAIATTLSLDRFILAAVGCGCAAAAAFAATGDPRLQALALQEPPKPDEAVAAAIAPDIHLTPEGAHWLKAWLMVRDNQIYRPWYDGRVSAQRRTQGNFDADWLHDQTTALMRSRETYALFPRAAFRFDIAGALDRASAPIHVAADDDLEPLLLSLLSKDR
jgi:pimeloyl-ACP methyl ester carboxylesterase